MKLSSAVFSSLGIHLSVAEMVSCCGLIFNVIKPDLKIMDLLGEKILQDLQHTPMSWINEVRQRKSQLIQSFYLTATDRDKVGEEQSRINFWCS